MQLSLTQAFPDFTQMAIASRVTGAFFAHVQAIAPAIRQIVPQITIHKVVQKSFSFTFPLAPMLDRADIVPRFRLR